MWILSIAIEVTEENHVGYGNTRDEVLLSFKYISQAMDIIATFEENGILYEEEEYTFTIFKEKNTLEDD